MKTPRRLDMKTQERDGNDDTREIRERAMDMSVGMIDIYIYIYRERDACVRLDTKRQEDTHEGYK